jgi:hypothetical protein
MRCQNRAGLDEAAGIIRMYFGAARPLSIQPMNSAFERGSGMTSRCRTRLLIACLVLAPSLAATLAFAQDPATSPAVPAAANPAQGHDYPTQGRVEYVLGCMDDNGHDFANVYKCSCAIDHIAAVLPYDDYVEQMTFSKYSTLGGEGGNEFRVDRAKAQTKNFRAIQAEAFHACGVTKSAAVTK